MPDHVLVAVDDSPPAEAALRFADDEWPDARLTLVHVVNPADAAATAEGGFPAGAERWYESELERAEELLGNVADSVARDVDTTVEVGSPADTICTFAEEIAADHVAIGSHGRTGIERVLLGSVAEGVVRGAPVPVTVVR